MSNNPPSSLVQTAKEVLAATDESKAAPLWQGNEEEFERHFDVAYSTFMEMLASMPEPYQKKYERTREVNLEAAVLWAIHEGVSHGLLRDDSQDDSQDDEG